MSLLGDYLPLTGGTISGNLQVDGRFIVGGTVWLLGSSTQIANAEFTTNPTLNNGRILDVGSPAADTDAANKAYVDSSISSAVGSITSFSIDSNGGSGYASLQDLQTAHPTGVVGTFYLVVSSDSSSTNLFDEYFWTGTSYEKAGGFGNVSPGDLATKDELDSYLLLNGSSPMTGDLNLGSHKITNLATPILSTDAVTKQYVDVEFQTIESEFATALQSYLQLKGGTMQGSLNMGGFSLTNLDAPVNASDAATKQYVDSQISGAGQGDFLSNGSIPMTGNLQMNNHRITGVSDPTSDTDASNKSYVDSSISNAVENLASSSDLANYLPLTGGTLTGILSMNNYRISNVATPVSDTDAANKAYVDSAGLSSVIYTETGIVPPSGTFTIGTGTSLIDIQATLTLDGISFVKKQGSHLIIGGNESSSDPSSLQLSARTSTSLNVSSDSSKYSVWLNYDSINGCEFYPQILGPALESEHINIGYNQLTGRFGTVYCESVSESSDSETKSDIHYLDSSNEVTPLSVEQGSKVTTQDVINFVKNLAPATFIYKRNGISTVEEAASENPDIIHLGIIANDIENDPLFNYVASKSTYTVTDESEGESENTFYSIKPASLAVAALTACKYLLQELEDVKSNLQSK